MSTINKQIKLLFKRKSLHQLLWAYQSNFKGSGLVYKESRPYTPGDPYHRIDRRTSAKKQDLFLKEFEEERMLRVLFVVHGGESMNFCSTSPSKHEIITTLGTLIGTIALQQGDQISYYGHTPSDSFYLPLSKSAHQTKLFEHKLASLKRSWDSQVDTIASLLHTYRIRHHLIVRISDTLITQKQPHLQALAQWNDILYCHMFDPFETDADPKHFDTQLIQLKGKWAMTTIMQDKDKSYGTKFQEHLHLSEHLLTSRGITTTHASTQDDPVLLLHHLFQKHLKKKFS